ncbi:MAG: TlpA family protein disulfide reductase [Flavobacteriales bacterium]
MKQIHSILLTFFFLLTFFSAFAQTAQNITFNDLDSVTHDLYTYLDDGYTVILDFSYEGCGPCHDWSVNVGHELWETFGPDGENILRMFFFDVGMTPNDATPPDITVSDDELEAYAQQWGIDYPLINLPGPNTIPEYPESGYPTIYLICPDRSLTELSGYGYPSSEMSSDVYFELCQGSDLDSNATLFNVTQATTQTLCNATPIQFEPSMSIYESNTILNNEPLSLNSFSIEVFINGEYINTENFDSNPQGENYHSITLNPINVNFTDSITFVCDYPGDNFAEDDTVLVVIPEAVNTPSSTDHSLILETTDNWLNFSVFNAQGETVIQSEGSQSFELTADSCYSIMFFNAHAAGATLKDINNHEILSYDAGQFSGTTTPRLYFHVSDNVGIHQTIKEQLPIDRYFIDVLGKSYRNTDIRSLPAGVYFEVLRYEDGFVSTKKHYRK